MHYEYVHTTQYTIHTTQTNKSIQTVVGEGWGVVFVEHTHQYTTVSKRMCLQKNPKLHISAKIHSFYSKTKQNCT